MRLAKVLLLSILMLSGCAQLESFFEETSDQSSENEIGEEIDQDMTDYPKESEEEPEKELSEEEVMIQELPTEANVADWNLILVNPWEALPENYEAEFVEVDNTQQIDARIVDAWNNWRDAALEAGHNLFFASGYRTVERQRNNFNNSVAGYLSEGYSEEESIEKTKEYLTEPGHSEHHTGLALDIVDHEWINAGGRLDPEYDTQESQKWLVETMADYGFILRYPASKEEITGIQYESWHFRYVGVEHAQFMKKYDLVLEEYVDLIKIRDEM